MEKTQSQHHVHLEATAKLLSGDLSETLTRASLDNHLRQWIEDLKAQNDNEHLHGLITTLQELNAHLSSGDHDSALIARLLNRLSTGAEQAAARATDETAPHIQHVATALAAAADQMKGGAQASSQDGGAS